MSLNKTIKIRVDPRSSASHSQNGRAVISEVLERKSPDNAGLSKQRMADNNRYGISPPSAIAKAS